MFVAAMGTSPASAPQHMNLFLLGRLPGTRDAVVISGDGDDWIWMSRNAHTGFSQGVGCKAPVIRSRADSPQYFVIAKYILLAYHLMVAVR